VEQPIEVPSIKVSVNLDELLIGDLALLEKWEEGDFRWSEIVEFLSRVATADRPISKMKMSLLGQILQQVRAALQEGSNPKN
jgi:hypothetical protein